MYGLRWHSRRGRADGVRVLILKPARAIPSLEQEIPDTDGRVS